MHSNVCPSFMDESLFSQEDLDLKIFQLESYLFIDEFLAGIFIPIQQDYMLIIRDFFQCLNQSFHEFVDLGNSDMIYFDNTNNENCLDIELTMYSKY